MDVRANKQRDARRPTAAVQVAIRESSLGLALVAKGANGLVAVLLGDDRDALRSELRRRFPSAELTDCDASLDALSATIVNVIEHPASCPDIPLDMRGSDFQCEVWRALREIPAGTTSTYTDIAIRIGRPRAVRAVAQACAANPLAVLVPCHRVVRRDGQLAGYRWGIERKRELLAREGAK